MDADHFGLSQLYQIRGRVGRSNKIAYCYLMYTPGKSLSEIATKRLNVIKDFTELGSGLFLFLTFLLLHMYLQYLFLYPIMVALLFL